MTIFLSPIELIFVIFALGVITGGFSNVTSGGAGVLTIYILTNWVGLLLQESTGTVLASSTIVVLIGAVSFWRKKQVDTQLAVTVGLSGVVGAFLAARWAATINETTLKLIFGGFTLGLAIYTSIRFFRDWKRTKVSPTMGTPSSLTNLSNGPTVNTLPPTQPNGEPTAGVPQQAASRFTGKNPTALAIQIAKGVLIGVATGLFGVGLASLSIVLFMLLFRLDTKMILGTSLFASFFRYLGGSLGYLTTGQIDPSWFLVLTIGGIIGSIVGARIILGNGRGSKDVYIKILVIGVLLFISYEFLLKYLFALVI